MTSIARHSDDDKKIRHSDDDRKRDSVENVVGLIPEGTLDPLYQAKVRILNKAIQEIGEALSVYVTGCLETH